MVAAAPRGEPEGWEHGAPVPSAVIVSRHQQGSREDFPSEEAVGTAQHERVVPVSGLGERCASCGQPLGLWAVDKLTGLLDRWGWDNEAQNLLRGARREGQPVALILADLDHFKQINEQFGHLVGDAILRAVARVLRSETRSVDIVGRYGGHGGDEFLVLLPGADVHIAVAVAKRIRLGVKAMRVRIQGADGSIMGIAGRTVSLGVAGGTLVHGVDVTGLVWDADMALREAKRGGRDRIVVNQGSVNGG